MARTDDDLQRRFDGAIRPVQTPDVDRLSTRRRRADRRRRAGRAAMSVVVVGLSTASFVWLRDAFESDTRTPATIAPAPATNGRIVFTGSASQGQILFTVRPDGTDLRQLTTGPFDSHADWSPDGRQIVFTRRADNSIRLFVVDVETGDTRPLTPPNVTPYRPAWSPDGQWVAFSGMGKAPHNGIFLVRPDGSDLHRIAGDGFFAPDSATWSQDSSTIAFTSNLSDGEGGYLEGWDVYLVDADGSDLRNLTNTPEAAQSESPIGWLPNGDLLISTSPDPVIDATGAWLEMTPDGAVVRTVFEYEANRPTRAQEPSLSPDGRFVVFDSARDGRYQQVWTFELATGDLAQVTADGGMLADWGAMPTGAETSEVPTAVATPAASTSGPMSLAGVPFPVCRPMSIPGTFADGSDTLWVFEKAPDQGCDGYEGYQYVATGSGTEVTSQITQLRDGLVDAVSAWPYATPDIDGDGNGEIALGVQGTPERGRASLILFRLAPLPGVGDAWGIERIALDCGRACDPVQRIDVGWDGDVHSGAACGVAPSGAAGLTRFVLDDGASPTEKKLYGRLWRLDGARLVATDETWALTSEAAASLPDGTIDLCGSPAFWPSDFANHLTR